MGPSYQQLSLHPLFFLGERFMQNPGAFALREGGVIPSRSMLPAWINFSGRRTIGRKAR